MGLRAPAQDGSLEFFVTFATFCSNMRPTSSTSHSPKPTNRPASPFYCPVYCSTSMRSSLLKKSKCLSCPEHTNFEQKQRKATKCESRTSGDDQARERKVGIACTTADACRPRAPDYWDRLQNCDFSPSRLHGRIILAQGVAEPGAGIRPVAVRGASTDPHHFGRFGECQSREGSQTHQLGPGGV